jgi:hypothetical protein
MHFLNESWVNLVEKEEAYNKLHEKLAARMTHEQLIDGDIARKDHNNIDKYGFRKK